jgi:hypothetical protein
MTTRRVPAPSPAPDLADPHSWQALANEIAEMLGSLSDPDDTVADDNLVMISRFGQQAFCADERSPGERRMLFLSLP